MRFFSEYEAMLTEHLRTDGLKFQETVYIINHVLWFLTGLLFLMLCSALINLLEGLMQGGFGTTELVLCLVLLILATLCALAAGKVVIIHTKAFWNECIAAKFKENEDE